MCICLPTCLITDPYVSTGKLDVLQFYGPLPMSRLPSRLEKIEIGIGGEMFTLKQMLIP
jgi:hypothetical protein